MEQTFKCYLFIEEHVSFANVFVVPGIKLKHCVMEHSKKFTSASFQTTGQEVMSGCLMHYFSLNSIISYFDIDIMGIFNCLYLTFLTLYVSNHFVLLLKIMILIQLLYFYL
jgi:hypothetical protein